MHVETILESKSTLFIDYEELQGLTKESLVDKLVDVLINFEKDDFEVTVTRIWRILKIYSEFSGRFCEYFKCIDVGTIGNSRFVEIEDRYFVISKLIDYVIKTYEPHVSIIKPESQLNIWVIDKDVYVVAEVTRNEWKDIYVLYVKE